MDPSERELIEAALRGDADDFAMIIPLFSRRLFAVAYGVLQDREEAEDVVQETLSRAYQSRWRLRDPAKFPAWLCTVARNRARDVVRRRRMVPLDEVPEQMDEPEPAHAGEEQQDILRAVALLPEQHRIAISLRYLEGFSHERIESTMGLSNGALRGILGRALEKLRVTLKPVFEEGRR